MFAESASDESCDSCFCLQGGSNAAEIARKEMRIVAEQAIGMAKSTGKITQGGSYTEEAYANAQV